MSVDHQTSFCHSYPTCVYIGKTLEERQPCERILQMISRRQGQLETPLCLEAFRGLFPLQ